MRDSTKRTDPLFLSSFDVGFSISQPLRVGNLADRADVIGDTVEDQVGEESLKEVIGLQSKEGERTRSQFVTRVARIDRTRKRELGLTSPEINFCWVFLVALDPCWQMVSMEGGKQTTKSTRQFARPRSQLQRLDSSSGTKTMTDPISKVPP